MVGIGFNVMVVVMFNLIIDLVGGVRVMVFEEEICVVDIGGCWCLLCWLFG